jgi:hypothetical protein
MPSIAVWKQVNPNKAVMKAVCDQPERFRTLFVYN